MEAYRIEDGSLLVPVDMDKALSTITQLLKDRTLVFFFGAGISLEYPSLLPLAKKSRLLPGLRDTLCDMLLKETSLEPEGEYEIRRLALETLLDFFVRALGDKTLEFYNILKPRHLVEAYGPNYRHYCLAFLSESGYCRYFVTVNFDTLVEDALKVIGVRFTVPEEKGQREERSIYSEAMRSSNDIVCLCKLHGTLSDDEDRQNATLLATVERVGIGLPRHKKELLVSLSRDYDIFFMGYSNNDIDVFPVFERTTSQRKVFWYCTSTPYLDDPHFRRIREFLCQREHYIFVGDLNELFSEILKRMNIDPSKALNRVGALSFEDIHSKQTALAEIRKGEIRRFVDYYKSQFLPTHAHAILTLAYIVVSGGFYRIGKRLLKSIADDIPLSDFNLRYAYASLNSEIYRNEGQYRSALQERKVAVEHLKEANYGNSYQKKTLIYQVIKNGSEHMNLVKVHASRMVLRQLSDSSCSEERENCIKADRALALKHLTSTLACLLTALWQIVLWRRKMTTFDRNTVVSRMYSECADFLHFCLDGLLFLDATNTSVTGGLKSKSRILRVFVSLIAKACAFLYRQTLRIGEQESEWYFFIKAKLAQVIMHAGRNGSWDVVNGLIDDVESYFGWGRDETKEFIETEEERSLRAFGITKGIRLYYQGKRRDAGDLFGRTLDAYKRTNHTGGIFEAKLWLAICQGNKEQIIEAFREQTW